MTERGDQQAAEPVCSSDVARVSVPLFEAAVSRDDEPSESRFDGYEVRPHRAQPSGIALEEGHVVGEFEV